MEIETILVERGMYSSKMSFWADIVDQTTGNMTSPEAFRVFGDLTTRYFYIGTLNNRIVFWDPRTLFYFSVATDKIVYMTPIKCGPHKELFILDEGEITSRSNWFTGTSSGIKYRWIKKINSFVLRR